MDKYLGKRLDGRYEMRELIGVGGMAYVYKAYDAIDDRVVAVKILRDEFLTNEEFVRRFRNESKAIAILNHPNIVKVLDVGFGERLQYIVMEYIDGITLKEYLDQRKDIRWKEAVHFTSQILRALQHAHDKGIVHRDIKPQNIMLLSDGTIKVTDFGIARLTRSDMRATTADEKAIGSVHYISPEQARGEITDEKADLYSVGIMLYEMLTGQLPFEADNAVSVAIMQMQSEAKAPHLINEEVPEGLEQITLKAMQKDTSIRYQSAAEMLSDFDEFKRNPSIKFEYTYFADETPTRYVDAITRIRGEEEPKPAKNEEEKPKKKMGAYVGGAAAISTPLILILGVVTLLTVGLAFFFGKQAMDAAFPKKENVRLEDFVGMEYNKIPAEYIARYEFVRETEYNAEYDYGVVFKQEPSAGSRIKENSQVILYVSLGTKLLKVPSVNPGDSLSLVKSNLTAAGFEVEEEEEPSKYKKGSVVRVSPEPGEEAAYGTTVTIYVSSGPSKGDEIDMPNVEGMAEYDAKAKLESAGFDPKKIKVVEKNSSEEEGTVIKVSPDHSEDQLPNVTITLTVSTGKLEMPNVIGMSKENAIEKLVSVGFKRSKIKVVEKSDKTVAKGNVIASSSAVGDELEVDATITLTVSSGAEATTKQPEPTGTTTPTTPPEEGN